MPVIAIIARQNILFPRGVKFIARYHKLLVVLYQYGQQVVFVNNNKCSAKKNIRREIVQLVLT